MQVSLGATVEATFTDFIQKYNALKIIDFPERTLMFPTEEELQTLPLENYTLNQISYRYGGTKFKSIQLHFLNGVNSTEFGYNALDSDTLETADIDTSKEIGFISV